MVASTLFILAILKVVFWGLTAGNHGCLSESCGTNEICLQVIGAKSDVQCYCKEGYCYSASRECVDEELEECLLDCGGLGLEWVPDEGSTECRCSGDFSGTFCEVPDDSGCNGGPTCPLRFQVCTPEGCYERPDGSQILDPGPCEVQPCGGIGVTCRAIDSTSRECVIIPQC